MSHQRFATSLIVICSTLLLLVILIGFVVPATPSNAQSNTATVEPTQDFGPTPSFHLTPSPTPHLVEPEVEDNVTCVTAPENDPPDLSNSDLVEFDYNADFDVYPVKILAFLNDGGSVEAMMEALSTAGNPFGPYISQVVVQDVIGDSVPEIFYSITVPVIPGGEYGDSFMFMFHCVDEEYASFLVFLRRGAGSRSEGLYAGGGVRIISIDDLNANGRVDIFYGVNWYFPSMERGHAELSLFEFGDDIETITPLFYEDDPFSDYDHLVYGDVTTIQFEDMDDDGIMEILIGSRVYVWDGEYYVLDEDASSAE